MAGRAHRRHDLLHAGERAGHVCAQRGVERVEIELRRAAGNESEGVEYEHLGIADHLPHDLEGRPQRGTVTRIDLGLRRAQLLGQVPGRRGAPTEQHHRVPRGVESASRGGTDPWPGTYDDDGISLGHD